MPRYYFHISDRQGSKVENEKVRNEGVDLPDKDAAWAEATTSCGEIIRDLNGGLRPGDSWTMIVKDETGADLFQLELSTKTFE